MPRPLARPGASRLAATLGLAGLLVHSACTRDPTPSPGLLLTRHPERLVDLQLPESSRPGGAPTPEKVGLLQPFERHRADGEGEDQVVSYQTPLPLRGVTPEHSRRDRPDGLRLVTPSPLQLSWRYLAPSEELRVRTWDIREGWLRIRLPAGEAPPSHEEVFVTAARQAEREDDMNLALSGLEPEDFAFRTLTLERDSRTGLLLPTPGTAAWRLEPEELAGGTRFRTTLRLLEPPVQTGEESDGAEVIVSLERGSWQAEVWRGALKPGEKRRIGAGLDAALAEAPDSGELRLRLRTEPGESPHFDYVFLDEPTLVRIEERPRRLLIVLVDTLRADRLGAYGHDRPTSPAFDALAAGGTLFTMAHAPAPWTLPSTRALLSGRAPEAWRKREHLGVHLAREGFATGFFAANAYLSRGTDMHLGWTWHTYELLTRGADQLRRVDDFLRVHRGQDAAVVLHLMEPHLPYLEPEDLRQRFAGPTPKGLEWSFNVRDVRRWEKKGLLDEAGKAWISDRYDQNVLAADRVLAQALELVGEDALVVVTSDHGEELWDHGGFEHGHALWQELVRVPLALKGPEVPQTLVDVPVSLTDVLPTVTGLLGLPRPEGSTGVDLRQAMAGDAEARARLVDRPLAFRDLLYRSFAVGVLAEGHRKWIAREGEELAFDLQTDPGEERPLQEPDVSELRAAFTAATGQQVVDGWRLVQPGADRPGGYRRANAANTVVRVTHPAGLARAFPAPDSLGRSDATIRELDQGVQISRKGAAGLAAEVFLLPAAAPTDTDGLVLELEQGRRTWRDPMLLGEEGVGDGVIEVAHTRSEGALRETGHPGRTVKLEPSVVVLPADGPAPETVQTEGMEEELRALGYVE